MQQDQTREHFNRLYSQVSAGVAAAKAEIQALKLDHEEGKREVGDIQRKLGDIQDRFDAELKLLEQYAEWDKFTIAFFGETNAGKSTIIDSLRILFNEQSRQNLLAENNHDLDKYESALAQRVQQVRDAMKAVYEVYAEEIDSLKRKVTVLAQILNNESAERVRISKDESLERNRILNAESAQKVAISQAESSHRIRQKVVLAGVSCFVAGAALSVAVAMMIGR